MQDKIKTDQPETVQISVYSNIRIVNGNIIAAVDEVIDTPIEILKEGGDELNGKRTR